MAAPFYLWVYIVVCIVSISAVVLAGVVTALRASDYPRAEVRRSISWAVLLLASWLAASTTLAGASTFIALLAFPGARLFLGGVIATAFCMAVLRTPTGARIIHAVPQSWLVGAQVYRLLGSIFLVLYASSLLPAAFALPAGIGDVTVGLLALPVALVYRAGRPSGEHLIVAWNLFGIADLVLALAMGVLTTPAVHALPGASSTLLASWPLVMVPLFAVPLSLVLHIASLRKLDWDRELAEHMSHATA